jgi:hypothetical protein
MGQHLLSRQIEIMNFRLLKSAVQGAGLFSVLVFFVVLLTLVFSFLGTIVCAALTGMMMGATRPSRWLSVLTALLFPAVIFTVLHVTKAELLERQILLVTLLCFGAFWLTYFAASWLMVFELKQQTPATQPRGMPTPPGEQPMLEPAQNPAGVGSTAALSALCPEPVVELRLTDLQGEWSCELPAADGRPQRRVIEIKDGKLVLRVLDADGRVCSTACADVKLESPGSSKTLVVSG